MNLLHAINAGVLAVTLIIAAILDFKYREIPRSVWYGAWLVAIPLGVYQWFGTYQTDPPLAFINAAIVGLILIGVWFTGALRLPMGDLIGLSTTFVALSYGPFTLGTLFFVGIWSILVAGITMIMKKDFRAGDIPYLVPVAAGVLSALLLIQ